MQNLLDWGMQNLQPDRLGCGLIKLSGRGRVWVDLPWLNNRNLICHSEAKPKNPEVEIITFSKTLDPSLHSGWQRVIIYTCLKMLSITQSSQLPALTHSTLSDNLEKNISKSPEVQTWICFFSYIMQISNLL